MDKPISTLQLSFLIFLLISGSSLVFIPGVAARQNAWFSTLLAAGVVLFVLYAVIKLHNIFPGQKITSISISVMGKIAGTIFNLLFLWSVLLYLIFMLYGFVMFLGIINPFLPDALLLFLLIMTCAYCISKGIIALGRLGELLVWPNLLLLLAGFILVLPLLSAPNLQPVLVNWKPVIGAALYVAEWPFCIIAVTGLFLPMVSGLSIGKNYLKLYWGYLGGVVFIFLTTLITITALGAELMSIYLFPVYQVFRVAGFGDFQRLELFFFFTWFTLGIISIMILYQSLLLIIEDILVLPDYKPLILPLGLCLLVFIIYIFPNTVEFSLLSIQYSPFYTLPINVLYPTILLIAAKIKQKRLKQETFLT